MKFHLALLLFVLFRFRPAVSEGNRCDDVIEHENLTWKEYCETLEYQMCLENQGIPQCVCVDGFVEDNNKKCKAFEFPHCPSLVKPQNGDISGACLNAFPGYRCNFHCRKGFTLRGSEFLTCQKDGTWDQNIPKCVGNSARSCPDLKPIANAIMDGDCRNAYPKSECSVFCNKGYMLSGEDKLVCKDSGTWNATPPACQKYNDNHCQNVELENGATRGNCHNAKPGARCNFRCNRYFKLRGARQIVCKEDGKWSGPLPTCHALKFSLCPNLDKLDNGWVEGDCWNARPDSRCSFSCNKGFKLLGSNQLICKSDGTWHVDLPTCEAADFPLCPDLEIPGNGTTEGRCKNAAIGSKCNIQCYEDIKHGRSTQLTCENNGTWDRDLPQCLGITYSVCPDLDKIKNGIMDGDCWNAGPMDKCSMYCERGYKLKGARYLVCSPDGTWSSSLPVCEAYSNHHCPDPGEIENGYYKIYMDSSVGQAIRFQCHEGYTLRGSQHVLCLEDGTWSASFPTCHAYEKIRCPELKEPENGTFNSYGCNGRLPDDMCEFMCNHTFQLVGDRYLFCTQNGTWDGVSPTCIEGPSCPSLFWPNHGSNYGDCKYAEPYDRCEFYCDYGFKLNGNRILRCTNNYTWDDEPPTCQPKEGASCPSLYWPNHGSTYGNCKYAEPDDRCEFYCNYGFKLHGNSILRCTNNYTWDDEPPTCQPTEGSKCPPLYGPNNGSTYGNCSNARPYDRCDFYCDDGFNLDGNSTLRCTYNYTWDAEPPTCQPTDRSRCPSLDVPNNGSTNGYCRNANPGDYCNFYCDRGFELNGKSSLRCTWNYTWNGEPPTCQPNDGTRCPSLDRPNNGSTFGNCRNAYPGDHCYFYCDRGFEFDGERSLRCTRNYTWDGEMPTCQLKGSKCPTIDSPKNGTARDNCRDVYPGEECYFSCDPGFNLNGLKYIGCTKNSTWNGEPPTCTELQECPALDPPTNGSITWRFEPWYPGNTCFFYCDRGFVLIGKNKLECTSNSTWNDDPPTCQENDLPQCPLLDSPTNGSTSGFCRGAYPGERCSFYCDPGLKPSGRSHLLCTLNSTWNADPPKCIDLSECPSLDSPSNGSTVGYCRNAHPGDHCYFYCDPGYERRGDNYLICTSNSTWDAGTPTCTAVSTSSAVSGISHD